MNHDIFLLLGTNVGNRTLNLDAAKKAISRISQIVNQSSLYKTAAWGNTDQPDFYNQVIEINTALEPEALLDKILFIEADLGRIRKEKWGPRIIDIDILFYEERVVQKEHLIIPHPGIPSRKFVLKPLVEIAPLFTHPLLKKTTTTLLHECQDDLTVEKVSLSEKNS